MKFHSMTYSKVLLGLLVALPAIAQQSSVAVDERVPASSVASTVVSASVANGRSEQSRQVLPLDHGPHAATTPWGNRQRQLHAEQRSKENRDPKGSMETAAEVVH